MDKTLPITSSQFHGKSCHFAKWADTLTGSNSEMVKDTDLKLAEIERFFENLQNHLVRWKFGEFFESLLLTNKTPFSVDCYATLHPALSVHRSVCRSLCQSVRHIFTSFVFFFRGFWPHCSCPNDLVTSITAPAHPHATGVAVYPSLFVDTAPASIKDNACIHSR